MRRGYNQLIRVEAIAKRYEGREWKEIQDAIGQKFGLKPSIRQMQKWFEDYQATTDDPTGSKHIAKVIQDAAELAKPVAQAKMMLDVMPLWSKLQERHNMAAVDAGWIAFLSLFEAQIGRRNFDRILKKYREIRDDIIV